MILLGWETLQALPHAWRQRDKVLSAFFDIGNASLLMSCILSLFIGGVLAFSVGSRMREFEGRTAVITGSASGMGLGFAECFGREGMNVVMADIEEQALKAAAARVESLGTTALPVVTDVGDAAAMDHLGAVTRETFGTAHVVCLNAGVSAPTVPMDELSANDWKWTLDVNLYGVIHGIRVFLPE